jgi:tetratricopeptide (TPR) repeat protein
MTRLTKYRVGYIAAIVAILTMVAASTIRWDLGWGALFIVGIMFLIPGRVQGILWRDFFRGSFLLRTNRPAEAVAQFESFVRRLQERPSLRLAMWLQWPGYTPNAMAMALNNLGASYLNSGALERAVPTLKSAVDTDPEMSIAWLNLAIAHRSIGADADAEKAAETARRPASRKTS